MILIGEDRLGDLAEIYADNVRRLGVAQARRCYRRDLCSCIAATARSRVGELINHSGLAGITAVLIAAVGFAEVGHATGGSWWAKSGFAQNPGYLVTENQINYPVCEPWTGHSNEAGHHVTAANSQAVLLPRTANVTKVYCESAGGEVSFSDSTYTRGRALTLTSANDVRYWVVWND
jgi:hypothetical protein